MTRSSPHPVHIRPATPADLETLVPLFDGYRQFYEQSSDLSLVRAFLRERLAMADTAILLAEEDGAAVGFVHLFPVFSSTRCRRLWLLNDLFVSQAARRQGVGRALMEAARQFAEQSGACGLELATAHTNGKAQRLYEGLGWKLDEVFRRYEYPLP
jgi:GNAT superfamily N-acetyltransferase